MLATRQVWFLHQSPSLDMRVLIHINICGCTFDSRSKTHVKVPWNMPLMCVSECSMRTARPKSATYAVHAATAHNTQSPL